MLNFGGVPNTFGKKMGHWQHDGLTGGHLKSASLRASGGGLPGETVARVWFWEVGNQLRKFESLKFGQQTDEGYPDILTYLVIFRGVMIHEDHEIRCFWGAGMDFDILKLQLLLWKTMGFRAVKPPPSH